MDSLLALIVSVFALINGYVYAKYVGTYINPVSVFSFFWFAFLVGPIILYPSGSISFLSVSFLVVFIFVFSVPFYLISGRRSFVIDNMSSDFCKKIRLFLYLSFVSGLVAFFFHLHGNGFSILDWLLAPARTTGTLVKKKYSGDLSVGVAYYLSVILMYPFSFYAGLLFGYFGFRSQKITVFSFVVPLLYFLVFGNKGALFLVVFLFFSGWLLSRSMLGQTSILRRTHLLPLSVLGIIVVVLVIFAFISRSGGRNSNELAEFLYQSVISYSSGHIFAFNDWILYHVGFTSNTGYSDNYYEFPFGYNTFKSFYDFFAYPELFPHQGVYAVSYTDGFVKSNIYTVFRGLVSDFGIFGTLLSAFFFGCASALFYRVLRYSKRYFIFGLSGWYVFFLFTYSSWIVSSFIWVSTTISAVIVLFLAFLFKVRWF